VDTEEQAKGTADECGIGFPVGYGIDNKQISELTGCFYEEKRQILHSTGYVIKPDGTIAVGVYSSGPIGRLVWQDVLAVVQYIKGMAAKS
jgi:alkyl hydroperoxide reductase subunit AhpC